MQQNGITIQFTNSTKYSLLHLKLFLRLGYIFFQIIASLNLNTNVLLRINIFKYNGWYHSLASPE